MASLLKRKLNIAFDLDGTLIDWPRPFWRIAGELAGVDMGGVEPSSYGLSEFPEAVRNMSKRLFLSEWFMCDVPRPTRGAAELVRECKQYGHVMIVTRRDDSIAEATAAMVFDVFNVMDIRFVAAGEAKWPVYLRGDVNIIIDDCLNDVTDAVKFGIKPYLIKAPWNAASTMRRYDGCYDVHQELIPFMRMLHGQKEQR